MKIRKNSDIKNYFYLSNNMLEVFAFASNISILKMSIFELKVNYYQKIFIK